MKNFGKLLMYFWRHLRKYKLSFFTATILFGAMVLMGDVITPVYIKKLTDILITGDIDRASEIMFFLLGLYVLMRIFLLVSVRITAWFEALVARDLHEESFEHFTKHSYHFYTNQFTGSLVEKAGRLGQNFISIFDNILFQFFSLFVTLTGTLIVLFIESIHIGLAFSVFLVIYILLVMWMNKKISPHMEARSKSRSLFKGTTSDILTNIQTVLFFGNRKYDSKRFKESNDEVKEKYYKSWIISINYEMGIGFIAPLFTILITFYALYLFSIGSLTTGSVVLVFMLANNVSGEVWRLAGSSRRLATDVADCVEALEIIEKEPEVRDSEKPQKAQITNGEISFNNVDFTYPEGEHVFKNFNLTIFKGQSLGVVGKSGSGKSTLTKLLLRLYDTEGGTITIDGQDISLIKQESLRKHIAYVPQETILFHRSIWDNIQYGNLKATKKEVMEASVSAHVDEFVRDLEEKYNTMVGERGIKLSGGQRQRIGIARAMLKKEAPILLMDEATSSLDSLSEQFIQDSFEKLSRNRTTIVIAHRLSTIQKMDRIVVMDRGEIIEDGSHEELLNKNGHYAELWNSQIDGFIKE